MYQPTKLKHTLIAVGSALTVLLAGCGGGTSPGTLVSNTNYGYFRVVNGSADSGSVDVYVDGAKQVSALAYGGVSNYIQFKTGSHTIAVDATGTQTAIVGIPTAALSQSLNGSTYVDLVIVGEQHPTVLTDTMNILAYVNTDYSTGSGGFAVNFHDAAVTTGGAGTVFGITSSTGSQQLGATMNVAGATQPVGVPSTFISPTETVQFTAKSGSAATVTLNPAQIDPSGCAANTLPCNSGSLSLYYIDGPAASTTPSAGPYPDGITATQTTTFAGIFDANGT
jgi:Domain of unknown function (DUF4397)